MTGYKNPPKEHQFKKGDPRCWRLGKPKGFDALRKLYQKIGDEVARDKDGQPIIINKGQPDEHVATTIEMIARQQSRDSKRQRDFVEYGYGKVPAPVELSGKDGDPIRHSIEFLDVINGGDED